MKPFNYGTMLFVSKPVSLPKISLILQKMNRPRIRYMPFLHKALQLVHALARTIELWSTWEVWRAQKKCKSCPR